MASWWQHDPAETGVLSPAGPTMPWSREVTPIVLTWRGKVGMFKRSCAVTSDAGRWHCITGYLDDGESSLEAALRELFEETGLTITDLVGLECGPLFKLPDAEGPIWRVHTFHASTEQRQLTLDWEHECYRWVEPSRVRRFDGQVAWLHHVTRALGLLEESIGRPVCADPGGVSECLRKLLKVLVLNGGLLVRVTAPVRFHEEVSCAASARA